MPQFKQALFGGEAVDQPRKIYFERQGNTIRVPDSMAMRRLEVGDWFVIDGVREIITAKEAFFSQVVFTLIADPVELPSDEPPVVDPQPSNRSIAEAAANPRD